MPGGNVIMAGDRVVKSYPAAADAQAAQDRARALIRQGTATPEAFRDSEKTISFQMLAGQSGTALLDELGALLSPLPALHAASLPLPPHDPFRRILPRLALAPDALRERIAALRTPTKPGPCHPVHGDFHPGQVIRTTDGKVWLIDLDDMAAGTVADDLGNLIAWLATAPAARDRMAPPVWRDAVLRAWQGGRIAPQDLAKTTEIALIRRALKRAATGDLQPIARLMSGGYADLLSGG